MNETNQIDQTNQMNHPRAAPVPLVALFWPSASQTRPSFRPSGLLNSPFIIYHSTFRPPPLKGGVISLREREGWDAFVLRSQTSQSDPLGLRRAETFWNSRSHGLTTVVPWSVPA